MSIPTNAEILALLNRLDKAVADELETQSLEFKPWRDPKADMRLAAEYAICLANAEGGTIVFGVADRVRGRIAALHGAKGYNLDTWRRGIFAATRPHLSVEVEELKITEGTGKLLIVRVPRGEDPPYGTADGMFKERVGKNCMPIDPTQFQRARVSTGAIDWSGSPASGASLSDLDPVEIARGRNVLQRINPESDLLKLDDRGFLIGLGAIRNGQVTHAGLLLFGHEKFLRKSCPQHQVTMCIRFPKRRFPGMIHTVTDYSTY